MQEHVTNSCENLISYMTGECSELENAAFELHLFECAACRDELQQLRLVWDALPYEMEEQEAPADLKNEVMAGIQAVGKGRGEKQQNYQKLKPINRVRRYFYKFGWIAAILIGIVVGGLWNKPDNSVDNLLNQPAEVVRTYELRAFDESMPAAKGTAWLLKHGDTNNVVVNLQGLQKTQGEWTYQVWLVRNAEGDKAKKRYNCGTMNVDDQGNGVLTYKISNSYMNFDDVGVTLEQDANGDEPRGRKVLGT